MKIKWHEANLRSKELFKLVTSCPTLSKHYFAIQLASLSILANIFAKQQAMNKRANDTVKKKLRIKWQLP